MDAEDEKAQRLPQMISPAQMRVFVREDVRQAVRPDSGREIDFRPEKAENQRLRRRVAQIDALLNRDRRSEPPPQPKGADGRIAEHTGEPRQPDGRCDPRIQLHRVGACARLRRKRAADDRIQRLVDKRYAAVKLGNLRIHDIGADRLRAGH